MLKGDSLIWSWINKYYIFLIFISFSFILFGIFEIKKNIYHSSVWSAKTDMVYQTISPEKESYNISKINVNSATLEEIESLPGIGPKIGTKIIEQRPYSNLDDLLKKGVVGEKLFLKVKNLITI